MNNRVLAIGNYDPWDISAMEADFDLIHLGSSAQIGELDAQTRAGITASAFKFGSFGPDEMDLLPDLAMISNYGVGYDSIDIAAARERGIRVTNTPDVLNDDVADLTIGMMLMLTRRMRDGEAHVRSGAWADGPLPLNRKFSGGRAGILGLGRIGRAIAERLVPFGMEIHYHARSEKDTPGWTYHDDPVSLAGAVDHLVIALVGGPATEKYVSAEVIAALGAEGALYNISRGTTVDEDALLDALEAGRLMGAGLDVYLGEPRPNPRFLALGNVVLQPHQASGTVQTRKAMGQLQRDNIAAHFAREDLLTPVA
ncbi:2-hydroxyacid dehydrogenase [Profundibacterium mesophilum]|uniref:1-deoxy-D-xylulose-5-phosphate reductoisomerase n=1 Tax=Profundibacterium mesophilum KAUST100406-0324 TaxID=1037889 RepID=A0A921NQH4_9RHOB|nr:2-hydroxyacid dehydrogenase [Profundibacterium mesophilum]KAF0675362.1 1-deoxy-D-xylulose-5-phosphate reductoisomerase [Profundibacterium mesophilum KAUST100406-0324]